MRQVPVNYLFNALATCPSRQSIRAPQPNVACESCKIYPRTHIYPQVLHLHPDSAISWTGVHLCLPVQGICITDLYHSLAQVLPIVTMFSSDTWAALLLLLFPSLLSGYLSDWVGVRVLECVCVPCECRTLGRLRYFHTLNSFKVWILGMLVLWLLCGRQKGRQDKRDRVYTFVRLSNWVDLTM